MAIIISSLVMLCLETNCCAFIFYRPVKLIRYVSPDKSLVCYVTDTILCFQTPLAEGKIPENYESDRILDGKNYQVSIKVMTQLHGAVMCV